VLDHILKQRRIRSVRIQLPSIDLGQMSEHIRGDLSFSSDQPVEARNQLVIATFA
jgi:hypothetical protein